MYFSSILALFLSTSLLPSVSAGQGFTQGLSIINAPSPGSPGHAGSPLPISVEVSGNGNLPEDSSFELLEIYLVSSDTEINMTVAQGTGFLTGETGSVRHLNWPVPQCTPPGDYNLTFYETTRIAGDVFFVITAVPLPVENPNPSGDCTADANTLEPQPQPFNPPDDPPLAGTPETMMTVTMPAGPFPTVTETSGSTVTVIMESITTVTTMQMGSNGPTTSTFTQTFWSTTAMDAASISGLVPLLNVDAGGAEMNVVSGSLKWITLASLIYAMMN